MSRETGQQGAGQRRRLGVPVAGIVLLVVGVVLLLQTTDVLPWALWGDVWRLWPALIIAVGINLAVGRRAPWLAALLIALVLGGAVALAVFVTGDTADEAIDVVRTSLVEPLGSAETLEVRIEFGAGELTVGSLLAGSPNLVEGTFDTPGQAAVTSFNRFGDVAELRLSMEGRRWLGGRKGAYWDVSLARTPRLSIDLDGGAARMTLDLRELRAADVDLSFGAADVDVVAPESAGDAHLVVEAGAADISVTVPEGVAARIQKSSGLASFDIDTRRFPKVNGEYVSPGFDDAENRVTITFRVGVSRVQVR